MRLLSILGSLMGASLAWPAASLTVVGVLPGGTGTATLTGLSADGSSAFGNSNGVSGFEAFRWRSNTGIVGLGDLPGGGFSSFALGSSANGDVIVGRGTPSISRGFRWTSAGMVQIAGLNGFTSNSDRAQALSNDGTVLAGWSNSLGNGQRATRWDGAGLGVIQPDLSGGTDFSDALGISGNGSRMVGWSQTAAGREACYWQSGSVVSLGDLAGGPTDAYANAASDNGLVIVGRAWDANGATAFRWNQVAGMQTLGDTSTSGVAFNSEAFDCSADGQIVVGRGNLPDFSGAFVWTASTGMVSVKGLLASQGVNVAGMSFNDARGISADGLTIAGNGVFNGVITGYVARLDPYFGSVSGQVSNFVPAASWSESVLVEFTQNGSVVSSTQMSLGAGGTFLVPTSLLGSTQIAMTSRPYLRKISAHFNLSGGAISGVNLTWTVGDADGSGEIDAADIDAVIASFGAVVGDPGYSALTDMDGSGEVDAADIDIVIANFGAVDE